jgi:RNA polymerase sigma factor (sigma-70 family)
VDNTCTVTDDRELLALYARDNDADAFRRLVERHIHFVYAAARRQVANSHLAEDVVQAVFLLLTQKAAAMKADTFLKGWLFHATRYAASNVRRTEARCKRREREAAAMRDEFMTSGEPNDIRPHLDQAMANLGSKDRAAILMRYFDEMPIPDVGHAMGISQEAAKKRIARAVVRLRSNLERQGLRLADGALTASLGAGLIETAPTHLITTVSALASQSATTSAVVASAIAKGASRRMLQIKLTVVAAKCVATMACVAAAAVAVQETRTSNSPAPVVPMIAAAAASQVSPPSAIARPGEAEYQACQQTLQAVIDAYDNDDIESAKAKFYLGPNADLQLTRLEPMLLQTDFLAYRLQKEAIAQFGVHALNLNYYWSATAFTLDELLSRIGPKDFHFSGDRLTITPPAPFLSHNGAWPKAPVYFQNIDGDWKLDLGRTFKLAITAKRRVSKSGDTLEKATQDVVTSFNNGYKAIADDLEQHKIATAGDLQKRLDGMIVGVSFGYSDFNIDLKPK